MSGKKGYLPWISILVSLTIIGLILVMVYRKTTEPFEGISCIHSAERGACKGSIGIPYVTVEIYYKASTTSNAITYSTIYFSVPETVRTAVYDLRTNVYTTDQYGKTMPLGYTITGIRGPSGYETTLEKTYNSEYEAQYNKSGTNPEVIKISNVITTNITNTQSKSIVFDKLELIVTNPEFMKEEPVFVEEKKEVVVEPVIKEVIRETVVKYVEEVGQIAYFATAVPPNGWLACDGSNVSRTDYADLFGVIGTTFGIGDGSTTFTLPDLRGEFIRGWDSGRGLDKRRGFGMVQEDAIRQHNHTGTTVNAGGPHTHVGTASTAGGSHTHTGTTAVAGGSHSHGVYDPGHSHLLRGWNGRDGVGPDWGGQGENRGGGILSSRTGIGIYGADINHAHAFNTSSVDTSHTHKITTEPTDTTHSHSFVTSITGAEETRPRNIALLACIKY